MTVAVRVVYPLVGLLVAVQGLATLGIGYSYQSQFTRGEDFVRWVTLVDPTATVFGYLLLSAGLYTLGAGGLGGRLRHPAWWAYLTAAVVLSSLLVAVTAVFWGFVCPTESTLPVLTPTPAPPPSAAL
jgi:hypothetical protein